MDAFPFGDAGKSRSTENCVISVHAGQQKDLLEEDGNLEEAPEAHLLESSEEATMGKAPSWYYRYMGTEELSGFRRYKYSSLDTSPLSNYVMHPFWNYLVHYVPRRIAPNTLTLTGFLLIIVNVLLLSYYDYFYTTSESSSQSSSTRIPSWVWLVVAFNHFWAHTLDGLDGKHARRTDSSSPLGELFDHGLDSWVTTLHVLTIYSVFGRDWEFGISAMRMYVALWMLIILFSLSHWEKYNTGILYLPWGYDFSQIIGLFVYLLTAAFGQTIWRFRLPLIGITAATTFELSLYAGAMLLTIPTTLRNLYRASRAGTLKHKSVPEALRPLLAISLLSFLTLLWATWSRNQILSRDFRCFAWMTGVVSSNITCALIINQMSSTIANWLHWLLIPVAVAAFSAVLLPLSFIWELRLLYILTAFVTVAHVHYGWCVVHQMATFLNIYAFSLKKPQAHHTSSSNNATNGKLEDR